MKNAVLFKSAVAALLITGFSYAAKAQGGDPPFVKGSNTIGLSIGFGDYYNYATTYGYGWTVLPSINLSYDHGFFENVGPGTIGIGGIIGIKNRYYKYGNGDKYTDNSVIVGVRGTYHLTLLADKNNKFDPYGGVFLGVRIRNTNDRYWDETHSYVNPTSGLFVGAKYNFVPNFGAFAEVGYDISFLKLGLNLNF
ncbi:MAG: hypothetical protein BWX95_01912 [Bacteroidetes bacterium ADurb.Bin141]|nr:hypothetical protein [Bacteroidota bacterium]MCB8930949.1 hypothetical protein [Bacteroidia bacterium]OQB61263.1 MAG: hypothetical protein BWX95_01912 [Bacteroidetes bacterium ADurb.Bin141]MCB0849276.1 hypothetical protein [Bacteroidota bacterium]MCO5289361.1 hypothetical protein [Bacteroidota bacterium]